MGIDAPACSENSRNGRQCAMPEGGYTPPTLVVYIDGIKSGDPDVLRGIRTGDVEEVRFLNANRAASEYGVGHEGGAILVKRYQGTKP